MSRRIWLTGLTGLAVMLGVTFLFSPRALADACSPNGLNCGIGYFTRTPLIGNPGFHNLYTPPPLGLQVNNVDDLVAQLSQRLGCGNGAIWNPFDQNSVGAAFTILTMLGAPPGTPRITACVRLGEWTALVRTYDAQGLINFNYMYDTGGINTRSSVYDVEYYQNSVTMNTIVFYDPGNPGNIIYGIKKDCGNPVGQLKSLEKPLQPTCGTMGFSPEAPDPNENIHVTGSVNFNTAFYAKLWQDSGGQFYIKVVGPNVNFDQTVPYQPPSGGLITATADIGATRSTGKYEVSWGTRGSTMFPNIECGADANAGNPGGPNPPGGGGGGNPPGGDTILVTDKPYMVVDGGDVSVGSGMQGPGASGTCATPINPNGGLASWNRGAANGYAGAGTNFGALALGYIQGIATGQGSPYAPNGLAMSNTTDDGSAARFTGAGDVYGGAIGAAGCVPNRFDPAKAIGDNAYPLNDNGPLMINNNDHRQPINIDGNVVIRNNVIFTGQGNYANVRDIPTFELRVRGNIYIAPGVSQLDGVYVAQPRDDGTGGVIYTCAPNGTNVSAAILSRNLYDQCGTPLTFNGAVIAKQLWLLRTHGTESADAAETFNFSPDVWLGEYPTSNVNGGAGTYQSITQLPPVL